MRGHILQNNLSAHWQSNRACTTHRGVHYIILVVPLERMKYEKRVVKGITLASNIAKYVADRGLLAKPKNSFAHKRSELNIGLAQFSVTCVYTRPYEYVIKCSLLTCRVDPLCMEVRLPLVLKQPDLPDPKSFLRQPPLYKGQ